MLLTNKLILQSWKVFDLQTERTTSSAEGGKEAENEREEEKEGWGEMVKIVFEQPSCLWQHFNQKQLNRDSKKKAKGLSIIHQIIASDQIPNERVVGKTHVVPWQNEQIGLLSEKHTSSGAVLYISCQGYLPRMWMYAGCCTGATVQQSIWQLSLPLETRAAVPSGVNFTLVLVHELLIDEFWSPFNKMKFNLIYPVDTLFLPVYAWHMVLTILGHSLHFLIASMCITQHLFRICLIALLDI